MHFALQVFCDEAGVPVTALPEEDISVHEQALDSQMRAFFRLTSFSHRYMLPLSLHNRLCRYTGYSYIKPAMLAVATPSKYISISSLT